MPTDGKPPLSDTEIEVISWWIDQGADPLLKVANYTELPSLVENYFKGVFDSMVSEEELQAREQRRLELYATLEKIQEEIGILILPLTPQASEFSVETFAVHKTFNDEALKKLEPFANTIVEADFSNTQLNDQSFQTLAKFANLRVLNLSKSKINGTGISQLAQLKELESLNLYGTALGKDLTQELTQLTQLKNLYLFQTDLYTDPILTELKGAMPQCNFVLK